MTEKWAVYLKLPHASQSLEEGLVYICQWERPEVSLEDVFPFPITKHHLIGVYGSIPHLCLL